MKPLILMFCLSLIAIGCKKNSPSPYESQGTLIGYDNGMCEMCGGLEIVIKNNTPKNPPPYYKINSDLKQLGISDSTPFPINVSLDWKPDTLPLGAYNYIIITKIKVD
jgi:hypothetical protein